MTACVCVCVFILTTVFLLFQPSATDHMRAANDLMQARIGVYECVPLEQCYFLLHT